ncbi:hypothetical protein V494_07082 [Pseudogymnoascus sp. VKM F-4513 (FW-928)]|nr:hypothetical protein V494_07082 [Pseudogymnoascus sp. VKM F-4513 (FW-928)]
MGIYYILFCITQFRETILEIAEHLNVQSSGVCATFGDRRELIHTYWKDTMETPDGKSQEQGSDMVTDHTSSDQKKDTVGIKSSSQNPESPHENRKPRTIIWESLYGVSRYRLKNPRTIASSGTHEAKETYKTTLAKADAYQNDASDKNTRSAQSSINDKTSPSTTIISEPQGKMAASGSGDTPVGPPVTKELLAELEIAMVIGNPKFRHDFNFGCNMLYAPKDDKGKSDEFWHTLRLHISELYSDRETFLAKHPGNTWTLPVLLKEIGEILAALLPQRDRSVIKETLDVDLLVQQLAKGQLNLEQLADFFSETMRKHCSADRDCAVFEMAKQLTDGFHRGDAKDTVDGLVNLLTTIEVMRLDVTNHQINHTTRIQDFVRFQQAEFLKIISTGDIDIYGSYAWFDTHRTSDEIPLSRGGGIWKFFRAFVDLLRHSNEEPTPDTLELDNERISCLRVELLNSVNISICMTLFTNTEKKIIARDTPVIKEHSNASRQLHSVPVTIERVRRLDRVRSALSAIVADYSDFDMGPLSFSASSRKKFDPWKVATPALALEILRSANAPLSDPSSEKCLAVTLSNSSHLDFRWHEQAVFKRLGELVQKYVDAWLSLDSLALYQVAPVCPNGCKTHAKRKVTDNLDEIARLIAYMGILHWNVWGKLVYLVNPNEHPIHSREANQDTGEMANEN